MRLLAALAVATAWGAAPTAAEPRRLDGRSLTVPSISQLARRVEIRRAELSQASLAAPPAGEPDDVSGPSEVETLEQEVKDLKNRASSLEDDKKELVHTVQQVLTTNQTLVLKRQIDDLVSMKAALEMRCARERQECEVKLNETQKAQDAKVQAAVEDQDSSHEVLEALREQNIELQSVVAKLRLENKQLGEKAAALAVDKENLMGSLHHILSSSAQAVSGKKAVAKTPVVRHDKKPASHHRHKRANGTNTSEPLDWNDPVVVMGETKEINAYLAHVKEMEAVEKAQAQAATTPRPQPRKLLRWLDLDATADGKVSKAEDGPSPLDQLAPTTTPPPPATPVADDSDDGVADLLGQAEAATGSSEADADA